MKINIFSSHTIFYKKINSLSEVIIDCAPADDDNTVLYIHFYCSLTAFKLIDGCIDFFGKYAGKIIVSKSLNEIALRTLQKKNSMLPLLVSFILFVRTCDYFSHLSTFLSSLDWLKNKPSTRRNMTLKSILISLPSFCVSFGSCR